jgi:hypothetical protein
MRIRLQLSEWMTSRRGLIGKLDFMREGDGVIAPRSWAQNISIPDVSRCHFPLASSLFTFVYFSSHAIHSEQQTAECNAMPYLPLSSSFAIVGASQAASALAQPSSVRVWVPPASPSRAAALERLVHPGLSQTGARPARPAYLRLPSVHTGRSSARRRRARPRRTAGPARPTTRQAQAGRTRAQRSASDPSPPCRGARSARRRAPPPRDRAR